MFADAAEEFAEGTIAATRASKKAAKQVRPSDEQKERHETGLVKDDDHWEDVIARGQDIRKSIKRGAEDKRDELLKKGVKKGRAVGLAFVLQSACLECGRDS